MRNLIKKILKEERAKRLPEKHPIVKGVKNLFKGDSSFKMSYTIPFEDLMLTAVINYYVKDVNLWREKSKGYYEGTIYVGINSAKSIIDDDSENMYDYDDFPHWVWDGLWEEIINTATTFLPVFKDEEGSYTIDIDFPDEW